MKKNSLKISRLLLAFNRYSQQNKTSIGKTIQVYTTAANTQNRLLPSTSIDFETTYQPIETEISVFVEPVIKF